MQDQSTQDQSLGDVAKAQRQKKTSSKVIDDEEMAQRRAKRGAIGSTLQCEAACVADVKAAVQQDSRLSMSEDQWQAALTAGEDQLAADDEWNELFAEIHEQICHKAAGPADSAKAADLDRRVGKKILDDAREAMGQLSHAMDAGNDQAALSRATNDARAFAVKQLIVKVQVQRAKQSCAPSSASSTKVPAAKASF